MEATFSSVPTTVHNYPTDLALIGISVILAGALYMAITKYSNKKKEDKNNG